MAKSKTIVEISRNINKKGRLKASSKKETKRLKRKCLHAKLNKEGKIKPAVYPVGKGIFACKLCGTRFHIKPSSREEINKTCDIMLDKINFTKYAAVAINADPRTIDYLANLSEGVHSFKKTCRKITNIAQKRDKINNKKKHKNSGMNNEYGSWR